MTQTSVPLPMYDFPELAGAHAAFRRRIVTRARRAGLEADVPLTQMCGYPLVTSVRGRFEAIATPIYDVPFSRGTAHRGLVVVRADARYASLEDLRASRFALNARDSNTGMNLPRALFAPLARGGRFFAAVVETGSHLAGLAAVRNGTADCASIDNVTFALLARQRPAAVRGVRVLAATAAGPALPFVVPAGSDRRTRTIAYESLAAAIAEGCDAFPSLRLRGIERASNAAYEPLLQFEDDARALGYGTLA